MAVQNEDFQLVLDDSRLPAVAIAPVAGPLMGAWGSRADRPRMLYLDKVWRELQHVFAVQDGFVRPRISLELVKGNVTPTGPYGEHVGFVNVLPPEVVDEVAKDIVLIEPVDDAVIKEAFPWSNADYVNEFLRQAQTFTTELARDGLGLVYTIR
jgi:hypothetical protein